MTLGIEVLTGRSFNNGDISGALGVAVVNETLASTYFPEMDPIGEDLQIPSAQRILGSNEEGVFEIVGVVTTCGSWASIRALNRLCICPWLSSRLGDAKPSDSR